MKTFVSYAHEDKRAHDQLKKHLANLRRDQSIEDWSDVEILPGQDFNDEIRKHLDLAELYLMLISPDFLDSSYCTEIELEHALECHKSGNAVVVPIIIEYCDWMSIEALKNIQALPTGVKPISSWKNENEAYLDVVKGIRRVYEKWFEDNNLTPIIGGTSNSWGNKSLPTLSNSKKHASVSNWSKGIKRINLREQKLENNTFSNIDVSGDDLQGLKLGGTTIINSDFSNINLSTSNLCNAKLINVNLCNSILSRSDFTGVTFEGNKIKNVDFSKVLLKSASLEGAFFENCIFSETSFDSANLTRATLENTDLSDIDFTKAILVRASLKKSNIKNANFFCTDLSWADLSETNFSSSYVQSANFYKTNIQGAIGNELNGYPLNFEKDNFNQR